MRKMFLASFSFIAIALLLTGVIACIGSAKTPGVQTSPGYIDSVNVFEMDGNVIAVIQVLIQGTYAQSLDRENITVKMNGSNVEVYVPVVTVDGPNTRNIGFETVQVVLGKASDFKDGVKYNIIVNGGQDLRYAFTMNDNIMTSSKPAPIDNIAIIDDGKNIIARVTMTGSGSQRIDVENAIKSETFKNNEYSLFVPMETTGTVMLLNFVWFTEDFVLAESGQLSDGVYTVVVNGQPVLFEIQNGNLI